jgi:serine/threonine protein kinase/tetratricopeptide (TPR) repeat protein
VSIEDDIARAQQMVGRELAEKFRLTACIGLGGTGAVYRAEQMALGRSVAVKILKDDFASDQRLGRRFRDEAMAASRLNHPNIVSIIDYGATPDGLLYLAMEYLRGPTLTQLIGREHPIAPATALDIVAQILLGIEEAHLAGVVHADLKSDNIIIDQRRAGTDLVKLVDFGIARMVNAPGSAEERVTGTPEYMAPEVIGGTLPTFAADIYAVGIMLYELLAGHTPFAGGNTVDVLTRQLKGDVPSIADARADLPAAMEFDAIIRRALAKLPGDRYASAPLMRAAVLALQTRIRRAEVTVDLACSSCGEICQPNFRFCPQCATPRSPTTQTIEAIGPSRPTIDLTTLLGLPLIERSAEQARLSAHMSAAPGAAGALIVVGPAGSGRSRLVLDTAAALAAGPSAAEFTMVGAAADPSGLGCTYYPIRSLMAALLELPATCGEDEFRAAVHGRGLSEPDVFSVMELFGQRSPLSELDGPERRRELVRTVVRVVQASAGAGCSALVFDDTDRYDDPSLEIVASLAAADGVPAMVLITEPDAADHWPATLPRLELGPLAESGVAAVVAHLFEGEERPAAAVVHAQSGGLPAYAVQLMSYLNAGGRLDDGGLPMADLMAARLSMLSQATLELCQAAAVFGVEVDVETLRLTAPVVDVDAALSDAVAHGILTSEGDLVAFASTIMRDVAYDATPAHVRRALHGAAADALEQRAPDARVLGHHHDRAGHSAHAVRLLLEAGDAAAHLLDDRGAAQLYQRALVAVRDALRAEGDDDDGLVADFVALSAKLAESLRQRGNIALARGVLAEARSWTERPMLTAVLDHALAHVAETERDAGAAMTYLRRAIGGAIGGGQLLHVVELYVELSSLMFESGDRGGAWRELDECLNMVTFGEGAAVTDGPANLWKLVKHQSMVLAAQGELQQAVATAEQALRLARAHHTQVGVARVSALLVELAAQAGQPELAAQHRAVAVTELRALGDRRDTAQLLALARAAG